MKLPTSEFRHTVYGTSKLYRDASKVIIFHLTCKCNEEII